MTMTNGERAVEARGIPTDTFGRRLMLARDHAGNLSIRDAADLCGIGRGAWTNWERGARPIDMLEIVEVISEKLGIDRDWLLWGGPLAKPEAASRAGMGRRLRRPTEEYGASAVRTRARSPHVPAGVGPTATPDRPTPSRHRPGGRNEGASTGPGLTRPAILPRRTSV